MNLLINQCVGKPITNQAKIEIKRKTPIYSRKLTNNPKISDVEFVLEFRIKAIGKKMLEINKLFTIKI